MDPITAIGLAFSAIKLALEIRQYLHDNPNLPEAIKKMLDGAASNLHTTGTSLYDAHKDFQGP